MAVALVELHTMAALTVQPPARDLGPAAGVVSVSVVMGSPQGRMGPECGAHLWTCGPGAWLHSGPFPAHYPKPGEPPDSRPTVRQVAGYWAVHYQFGLLPRLVGAACACMTAGSYIHMPFRAVLVSVRCLVCCCLLVPWFDLVPSG